MTTEKIQEITEKIYNEGIVKAKSDAEQIIAGAKKEAEEIIRSASKEKKRLIEEANRNAGEILRKTESEMSLAARQFVSNLKQQITGIITARQISPGVESALRNKNLVKEVILTLVKNWNPQNPEENDIKVLLPMDMANELAGYFESKAIEELNKKVEIHPDPGIKSGFKAGPADGRYILSFTDADFENYLKKYFKERTWKLLFGAGE